MALTTYALDGHDLYPGVSFFQGSPGGPTFFPQWVRPSTNNNVPAGPGLLFSAGGVTNPHVFYCPGRTEGDRMTYTGYYYWDARQNVTNAAGSELSYWVASSNDKGATWFNSHNANTGLVIVLEQCNSDNDPTVSGFPVAPFGYARHNHGPGYNYVQLNGAASSSTTRRISWRATLS